jgi:hypothetical protein
MAELVQFLLPTRGADGREVDSSLFSDVQSQLAERFGGVTAYVRAPAKGLWRGPAGAVADDDVVMVEVEVEALDREWWIGYRRELARQFHQHDILMRAITIDRL